MPSLALRSLRSAAPPALHPPVAPCHVGCWVSFQSNDRVFPRPHSNHPQAGPLGNDLGTCGASDANLWASDPARPRTPIQSVGFGSGRPRSHFFVKSGFAVAADRFRPPWLGVGSSTPPPCPCWAFACTPHHTTPPLPSTLLHRSPRFAARPCARCPYCVLPCALLRPPFVIVSFCFARKLAAVASPVALRKVPPSEGSFS